MKHPRKRLPQGLGASIRRLLFGPPRDAQDTSVVQRMSLIAFLAWVGLGADGLSSSAYGPEEAYKALGEHTYLAILLAGATALTVFIISYAYSRIIEQFPQGGGGYIVATKLLGGRLGAVSGCALLVDYVLTITVSIASGGDAVFSLLPLPYHKYKLFVEFGAVVFLMVMNLRGVKESVAALLPIFLTFLVTHVFLIGGGILSHLSQVPVAARTIETGFQRGAIELGRWGMFVLFLRAYSMGAGTYTGIEAVSNGIAIMREPKVETGKRTMAYLAISLAVTAAGLIVCYLLFNVHTTEGQTLNAILAHQFFGGLRLGRWEAGVWIADITVISEAVLLLVAAQTGFVDGPRVMAYMATDLWLPRRFALLSERLTIKNGVLLIAAAAAVALGYTRGHLGMLIVMYSINVFVTFSLSETGMTRFWMRHRQRGSKWKRHVLIHGTGLVLCFSVLCVMLSMKFTEGGWITVVATLVCIALCFAVRRHYGRVSRRIQDIALDSEGLRTKPAHHTRTFDPRKPTAVILVGNSEHLAKHCFLTVFRVFHESFQNVIFVSVSLVDSDLFKSEHQLDVIEERTKERLSRCVHFAKEAGVSAHSAHHIGTDVVQETAQLCLDLLRKHPRAVIFAGEVAFDEPRWYDRLLHNETAYAIQQRLRFAGVPVMILPVSLPRKKKRGASGLTLG
ncbi:MAG TPA: APC family permease [Verrucomicrobiae bacterium]|nr:APC family permease [Verrucomicrobiae bacterium]